MTYTSALTYATQRQPLDNQIGSLLAESDAKPVDFRVMSVIVPGSDHLEGAPLAADVYRSLPSADIDTVLSVAANSGDAFKRITVCSLDAYQTPLGEVNVDDKIRNELCDEDDDIFLDDRGHFLHHGLDINLPFLQKALQCGTVGDGGRDPGILSGIGARRGRSDGKSSHACRGLR
jgi:AmmeMemoRadiSam system protein B